VRCLTPGNPIFPLLKCTVVLLSATTAFSSPVDPSTAAMCDAAAQRAAKASGVPLSVMRAITRTETGRSRGGALEPWPWTVNMEGEGKWFDTKKAALDYVMEYFDRGARSFDVGCFQINYRWHGSAFNSIAEMFDPDINARYAARFLSQLYEETGDWSKAAGAYHSRTQSFAERYAARFDRIRQKIDDTPLPVGTSGQAIRTASAMLRKNAFPLLKAGGAQGGLGSLVSLSDQTRPAFVTYKPANGGF